MASTGNSRTRSALWLFMVFVSWDSVSFVVPRANAQSLRNTLCVAKLQHFVMLIDGLLTEDVVEGETFWKVIRDDLPATGCSAEEVLAISQQSKFFSLYKAPAYYTITFKNQNMQVSFQFQKETTNIERPYAGSARGFITSF